MLLRRRNTGTVQLNASLSGEKAKTNLFLMNFELTDRIRNSSSLSKDGKLNNRLHHLSIDLPQIPRIARFYNIKTRSTDGPVTITVDFGFPTL